MNGHIVVLTTAGSEEEAKKDFEELKKFDAIRLFQKGDVYTKEQSKGIGDN